MNKSHKVELPIFSVHGNHDQPVGLDLISAVDQFKIASFINYFGKVRDVEDFVVEPILFERNGAKLALYGIGYINDKRLNLSMKSGGCSFNYPKTPSGEVDQDWHHILIIH